MDGLKKFYLSKYGYVLKFWTFGYLNSKGRFVYTLSLYLGFMEDM